MSVPLLSDIFGTKPEIIPYTPTDFSVEQLKSINEDIAAFPQFEKLGTDYYDYMLGMFNKAIPEFSDILATGGKLTEQMQSTAAEELAGKIPQDVADQVFRSSAFQSLMAGTAGGPIGEALAPRALGLTSLDLITRGQASEAAAGNAAQRWAGIASGLMLNPAGFLVSPQQQAELTMQNNLYRQATQQRAANVAAAPNPIAKGLSDIVEYLGGIALSAYTGGGGMGKAVAGPGAGGFPAGNAGATAAAGAGLGPAGGPSISQGPALNLGTFGGSSFAAPSDPFAYSAAASLGGPPGAAPPVDLWGAYNPTLPGSTPYNPFQFGGAAAPVFDTGAGITDQNSLWGAAPSTTGGF